ncbi:MAG: hypothetical protein Q8M83_01800 [bacterium]|nr:hypothetical protein [bacterium]
MSKTLAPSVVTSRDPKGFKFVSIIEAAYNKAGLSEEEAQRVNDTPGLAVLVGDFITRNRQPDQFANEEVRSSYTYPKEYKGPKPIADQIKAIAKIFDLNPSQALKFANPPTGGLPALPEGAEGWFAIPSVDALAKKHFPEVTDPAQKYCQAILLVHAKITASRSFYDYREGQITPAQLRVHARTAHALDLIAETQKGDILIIAAQLGMRHRGKSVRRAREVFMANEFGLGSLAIGSVVLTHPERLVRWEELQMDCSGDEFAFDADGSFGSAPCFDFVDVGVRFGALGVSVFGDLYGSASGFLTQ